MFINERLVSLEQSNLCCRISGIRSSPVGWRRNKSYPCLKSPIHTILDSFQTFGLLGVVKDIVGGTYRGTWYPYNEQKDPDNIYLGVSLEVRGLFWGIKQSKWCHETNYFQALTTWGGGTWVIYNWMRLTSVSICWNCWHMLAGWRMTMYISKCLLYRVGFQYDLYAVETVHHTLMQCPEYEGIRVDIIKDIHALECDA